MQVEQFYNPMVLVLAFYLIVGGAILRHILKCFVNYLVDHSHEWKAKGVEMAEYYVKWILFLLLAAIIFIDFLWTQAAGHIVSIVLYTLLGWSLDPAFCQLIVTCIAFLILYIALKRAFHSIKQQGIGIVEHPLLQPFRVDKTVGQLLEARRQRATPLSTDDQESLLAHIIDADSRGLLSLVNLSKSKKQKQNRR